MTNIQRVSMINSNQTQLNSDYDFSMLAKWLLNNQGGVFKESDFVFNKDTGVLSAGSDIAEALVLCKRQTSNPLPNQTFLAQFQFSGTVENVPTENGTKIWIEIKENLIVDPTLIEDENGASNFAKGFNIGEIKSGTQRPDHSNYLKLWEIEGGELVDRRNFPKIPGKNIKDIDFSKIKGWDSNVLYYTNQSGELTKIPLGTQGQSLVINPDGKPIFGTSKSEVSYLSAKRELGEDFDLNVVKNIVPVMASNNQDGRTVSASSEYNTSEYNAWRAFQGERKAINNCWHSGNNVAPPHRIQVQAPEEYIVKEFSLQARYTVTNQFPKDFKFQGSNDGTTWTDLGSWTGETVPNDTTIKKYQISNKVGYSYYRLYITSSSSNPYTTIGCMKLFGHKKNNPETAPKAYFIGEGTTTETVVKSSDVEIGKDSDSALFLLKHNETNRINNLKFRVEKVGNIIGDIKLHQLNGELKQDTQTYTQSSTQNQWKTLKTLENIYGDFNCILNTHDEDRRESFRVVDKNTGEVYFGQGHTNRQRVLKTFTFNKIASIDIQFKYDYSSSSSTGSIKNITYNQITDTITTKTLAVGENNITLEGGVGVKIQTEATSTSNYYTVGGSDGTLAGEYALGYGADKKYISNSTVISRAKVDGLELTGGTKGETTTGIEGGVYELPEGVEYSGDLYVQSDGTLNNQKSGLYFGKGFFNKIKLINTFPVTPGGKLGGITVSRTQNEQKETIPFVCSAPTLIYGTITTYYADDYHNRKWRNASFRVNGVEYKNYPSGNTSHLVLYYAKAGDVIQFKTNSGREGGNATNTIYLQY